MNLTSPLEKVKGVGVKTGEQFALAGLHTVGDLIEFLPRAHEDFSDVVKIGLISPGKRTIKARCEKISTRPVRRGLRLTTATLADDTGKLQAIWFNQPYRETQLKSGEEFLFSGEFEFNYNKYQLSNPTAEKVSDVPVSSGRIVPVYRAIKGLKSQLVRKIVAELRPLMTMLPETLPESLVKSEKLLSYSDAVIAMHFPKSIDDITRGKERLAFEELFVLLLASQLNKQENAKLTGWHIPFEQKVVAEFVGQLPFELTGAQRRAAWEIIQDFEQAVPMNRLLQGDVGSGKTVVAGLAARQAASHNFQTALMAPTEILASQHAETLSKLLQPFGVTVGLLTGSVKGTARKVRKLYHGKVLAGFAGATADAFTLFERFEAKLEKHQGHLVRAAIELTKDWRTDRVLRRLEAMLAVADKDASLIITGNGDVLEPENGIVTIGSGGAYAQAAAIALLNNTELGAADIVKRSLEIAGELCIYTNMQHTIETLD